MLVRVSFDVFWHELGRFKVLKMYVYTLFYIVATFNQNPLPPTYDQTTLQPGTDLQKTIKK